MAPSFKGKVRRFVVIPILTVEDSDGNPFREEKGKPFTVLTGNLPDLKKVAEQYEQRYEREYISKLNERANSQETKSGRYPRVGRHRK